MSVPGKLVGLAVSGAVLLATPVHAGEGAVTPGAASNARLGVAREGKGLSARGDFDQAAALYWREGGRLKGPVLILDSAEALRDRAAAERSIDAARSAIDRAAPALDMLYYL